MVPYLTRCDRLGNILKTKYGPLNEVSINFDPKQLFFVTSYDNVVFPNHQGGLSKIFFVLIVELFNQNKYGGNKFKLSERTYIGELSKFDRNQGCFGLLFFLNSQETSKNYW